MKKYNLSSIMRAAWKFYRKGVESFAQALRIAWANAKVLAETAERRTTKEFHTWAGWRALGYEVIHGSTAAFTVRMIDPATKSGTRMKSYFTAGQVQPITD